MKRLVLPEILDQLPPDDPLALRSRGDLRRINALMRNPAMAAAALRDFARRKRIDHVTELGAGDGNFLLQVAQKISPLAPEQGTVLLDFKNNISGQTLAAFRKMNWQPQVVVADVFDWPELPAQVVVANLFLHHFEAGQLQRLLSLIARRAEIFIAVEPRRGCWPLMWSRLLWLLGCNSVTQHDAVVSVRAGFCGKELSGLWPKAGGWALTETFAPPFSHLFIACRCP